MKQQRHPHPHIDPRQPRDAARPGTNPPVFAWKPSDAAMHSRLVVARDAEMQQTVIHEEALADPVYLPTRALEPGVYFWRWEAGSEVGELFSFEITQDAVVLEIPPVAGWLERLGEGHPRIYVGARDVQQLREAASAGGPQDWDGLREVAEELLAESHEIAEPPYLPDRRVDYQKFFTTWAPIMWDSRRFVKGAETLALAYLVSGEEKYGRAACERMASISKWDPEGSSHLAHNDEAHMSVIWHGAKACDWVWDLFTEDERQTVIWQFRKRGELTYEHMHGRGCYGVTRFDSHAGREIVFLALTAMVFHEHIPDAVEWLEWLRPVLCGIWPVWAGDDGAWAEGPSYGLAYVTIMTMFATALKQGTGTNLYSRPFWRNHALWREWCMPFWAEWMGFGDHSERWKGTWLSNARLVETIDRQTGPAEFTDYVRALRDEASQLSTPDSRRMPEISAQEYIVPPNGDAGGRPAQDHVLTTFPAAGAAAIRTDLSCAARDIAMIFRSSPYGAISHSHASNNDFVIHVAGKAMAMPSGYYDGYGSNHHTHWVWHTKSHNCITLSDAPQIMRSHESRGAVVAPFEDDLVAYFCGNADASYADRAERCRRHVVFLKSHQCFFMVDEFVGKPAIVSALQWNIHSWNSFDIDEDRRYFALERDGSTLQGYFLYHHNSFFSVTDGWDPGPQREKPSEQWYQQFHLRFTAAGLYTRRNLGTVLCPGHSQLAAAHVVTERVGDVEVAHVGQDSLYVSESGLISCGDAECEGLAAVSIAGRLYAIGDSGIVQVP